ncbi:MAG: ATP synthase subunit I [Burkholderiales bacterium]
MLRIVLLQFVATLFVALLAAWFGGQHAVVSAALGGLVCFVPNALLALRLTMTARGNRTTAATFFIGEFVKVATMLLLLVAVVKLYGNLVWWALLLGLIAALKSYFVAILFLNKS